MGVVPIKKQPTQRTATREARRQQLINATIDSVAKAGFSGTTLTSVTTGANLSHGVVNFHFESKDALYDATLDFMANEHYELWLQSLENAGPEPEKKLAAILKVDFDKKICTPQKIAVWFAFWGQSKYRPNYIKIYSHYDGKRFDQIKRLCKDIIIDGKYEHLNAERCARLIVALVDGLWLNFLFHSNTISAADRCDDCFALLSDLFPKHFPRV